MNRILMPVLLLATVASCNQGTEQKEKESADTVATSETTQPALNKTWETDTVFTTSESVLYDNENDILYVSNIVGNPTGKDGAGFISKLNPDGSVEEMEWVTGLNAPKGMAILNDKLYVTDIDELVEIDMADGKVVNTYEVEGAQFLNDAATDGENVYFSDSGTGKTHILENDQVSVFKENLEGINGLEFDDDGALYVLDKKGLQKFPPQAEQAEMINDKVTGGDGLVIVNDSTYIASRWQGEIYLIVNGEETLLLDTKDEANTADIGYIPDENLVLVPTFKANQVVAYEINY